MAQEQARSTVSIHDVGAGGATGPRSGTGVLIGPTFVLVHPRLATELAPGGTRALRVGVAPTAEVIDVAQIQVSPQQTRIPLVALVLSGPSTAPVDPLGAAVGKGGTDALVDYLSTVQEPVLPHPPVSAKNDEWYCWFFPGGPGCP